AEVVGTPIFLPGRDHESCVAVTWDGVFHLRHGTAKGVRGYERAPFDSTISCPATKVSPVLFDKVLELGRAGTLPRLFLSICYEHEGEQYRLHAPARYINFPAPGRDDVYLQPISGNVLFYERGRFRTAYVAAHIRRDNTAHVEFIVRDEINVLNASDFGA